MRFITFCILLLFHITSLMADEAETLYDSTDIETPPNTEAHPYLGGSLGWSKFQDACSSSSNSCTDDVFSYGVYAGYQFSTYFALETAFNAYSDLKANASNNNTSVDFWESDLAMVFTLPLRYRTSVYSKLGGTYTHLDKAMNDVDIASAHEWDLLAALGVNYRLSPNWSLRGEYKFIDGVGSASTGQADLHSALVGLTYHFVKAQPAVAYTVATVEPKKQDDDSAIPQQVSLSSEQLFGFDSAILKYSDELETYVTQLTQYPNGTIKLIGYTDSIGSKEYNRHLAELRAQSVAEYLKRMGVNEDRIVVEGRGEDNFKATNDTKYGRAKNRRVEIYFSTQVEPIK